MSTRWDTEQVAAGFNAYDDLPERTLGYPFVFQALRLGEPDIKQVLDYGCGPGKVAERVVRLHGTRVVAVDSSAAMLSIAQRERAHSLIDYRKVEGEQLPFLGRGSVDAAMSCYVFINIASLDQIRSITAEVHRVLRPGGRYALLDTNPDTTGVQFSTFRSGDPGRSYAAGERRRVLLSQPDGDPLELVDYHWPKAIYHEVLTAAGFRRISMHEPVLVGAEEPADHKEGWASEMKWPPFLIVVGEK